MKINKNSGYFFTLAEDLGNVTLTKSGPEAQTAYFRPAHQGGAGLMGNLHWSHEPVVQTLPQLSRQSVLQLPSFTHDDEGGGEAGVEAGMRVLRTASPPAISTAVITQLK